MKTTMIKTIPIAALAAMLLTLGACSNMFNELDTAGGDVAFEYELGDEGPAGGRIFYIDKDDNHSWTYLEAAPEGTEWNFKEWGGNGTKIGGDAQLEGIGDGRAATDAIVDHMESIAETGTAAQICDGLSHNGYDDWFLPSLDELEKMHDNLYQAGLGGFTNEVYWSSSEEHSSEAHVYDFMDYSSMYTKDN
ncbi:MAG TPA: hypothetical protein VJ967_00290, partial [Clostridia bacterium]|nr:hypothetical protein [Clostridia bacterium]